MTSQMGMEAAAQQLLSAATSPNGAIEFDISLLDTIVNAAYSPIDPNRALANKTLMALQETEHLWTKADMIMERSNNSQSKFFGLQVLDDVIRTRCVVVVFFFVDLHDIICVHVCVSYMSPPPSLTPHTPLITLHRPTHIHTNTQVEGPTNRTT